MVLDYLLGAFKISVDEEGPQIDAEACDKPQRIHIRKNLLASAGNQDDGRKERGIEDVDAIQGMSGIGSDEPPFQGVRLKQQTRYLRP